MNIIGMVLFNKKMGKTLLKNDSPAKLNRSPISLGIPGTYIPTTLCVNIKAVYTLTWRSIGQYISEQSGRYLRIHKKIGKHTHINYIPAISNRIPISQGYNGWTKTAAPIVHSMRCSRHHYTIAIQYPEPGTRYAVAQTLREACYERG